jgi:hypothetical protein
MDRIERLARNQMIFRQVNERLRELEPGRFADGAEEFVCECSREDCTELLEMSREEYAAMRGETRRYVTKPDHDFRELELVVDANPRFQVVEKVGRAAAAVEEAEAELEQAG